MERPRLVTFYAIILAVIFGLIVVHAPLTVWLGTIWPAAALLIKSWKEILMIPAAVLAVIIVSRQGLWRELLGDWVFRLIASYAAVHLLLLIVVPQDIRSSFAGLAIDLRYVLFFGLAYILVRVAPQWRRRLLAIAAIGAAVVVGFASLETLLPRDLLSHIGYSRHTIAPYLTVDENPDFVRYNGTLRGPNPLGAYAVIVLATVSAVVARRRVQLDRRSVAVVVAALTICGSVALWVSYSRSALVAGIAAVFLAFGVTVVHRPSRRSWIGIAIVCIGLLGGVLVARDSYFVSNVLLHENASTGAAVSSNQGHLTSLAFGIDRLIHQPLGAGVGSTGSASLYDQQPGGVIIENQYLFIGHETGWLGLVIFITLYYLVMARLWRARTDWLALGAFASGLGLALIGLLLPVWVDDTVALIWWGLAAIAIGSTYDQHSTNQETARTT